MKKLMLVNGLLVLSLLGCATQDAKDTGSSSKPVTKSSTNSANTGTGSGTLVIKEVVFGADSSVPTAVRNECDLLNKLSEHIKTAAAPNYAAILEGATSTSANADVLSIEIINLVGPGGGAWSGGKSVMIKGTLSKQGKVSNFKALRVSMGGMWGGYMGTCAILGRCVKTLGEDVANWLQHPTPDAVLGDM